LKAWAFLGSGDDDSEKQKQSPFLIGLKTAQIQSKKETLLQREKKSQKKYVVVGLGQESE
jgi:hypothetical protein